MTEAAAPEHAEPILRLRGIGRRFGGLHAVREVDLTVALARLPRLMKFMPTPVMAGFQNMAAVLLFQPALMGKPRDVGE